MPGKQIGHSAALNIYADYEGYIESITGLEQARELSSIVYLTPHAETGDIALFANNGGDAIIDGMLSHKDQKQLQKDIKAVRNLIKITIQRKEHETIESSFSAESYL